MVEPSLYISTSLAAQPKVPDIRGHLLLGSSISFLGHKRFFLSAYGYTTDILQKLLAKRNLLSSIWLASSIASCAQIGRAFRNEETVEPLLFTCPLLPSSCHLLSSSCSLDALEKTSLIRYP